MATVAFLAVRIAPDSIRLLQAGAIVGHVFKIGDGWHSSVNSVGHRPSRRAHDDPGDAAAARWRTAARTAVRNLLTREIATAIKAKGPANV